MTVSLSARIRLKNKLSDAGSGNYISAQMSRKMVFLIKFLKFTLTFIGFLSNFASICSHLHTE